MSCKKTRLVPGNAPGREVQKRFAKKMITTLKRAKKDNNIVLFADPTHQIYNVENGYAWQEIGAKHTKIINSNSGRRRINILGALNPESLKPTALITEENCGQETMIAFLGEIRKEYEQTKKIYIFVDNASYNRSRAVGTEAQRLKIKLIFLPAYCPNLNLIERLWKFFKKKIRKNRYYDTFEKFEKAVCEFFKDIDRYKDELKKLLTMKFEII